MNAFYGKTAVITGGAHGIGKAIADAFRREGASVYIIDRQNGDWFVGDVSDQKTLEKFAESVVLQAGHADYLINNALPVMKGIDECSWDEFSYALAVGVTAPFYLTKLFLPYFAPGASVINIASSRDRMSQPQTESYTAAKGGIAALTHAMAISLAGRVRVNSISPAGLIQPAAGLQERMHCSSLQDASENRKTLQKWRSSSALRRRDLSPEKTYALTAE